MVDFENEGKTHLCMTFRVSGCKHHTDMIFVSILTFSRTWLSKIFKLFTSFKRLTLELKVIHIFPMTLLMSGCMHAIDPNFVSNITFTMWRISENPKSVT